VETYKTSLNAEDKGASKKRHEKDAMSNSKSMRALAVRPSYLLHFLS